MSLLTAAKGLKTQANQLARPEGSLSVADNVVIDYDHTIQKRRGFSEYNTSEFASAPKQLFTYRSRILTHYENNLAFDSTGSGVFTNFSGDYQELIDGLRLRAVEANGNLYFTTSTGIKKISAKTAADIGVSSITEAGGVKAIDLSGAVVPDAAGFLPAQSKVAYRLVFGTKDSNSNLVTGSPSSRLVLTNSSADVNHYEIFTVNILNYAAVTSGQYFLFDLIDGGYFVYFDKTGTTDAPVNSDTIDREAIKVVTSGAATNSEAAAALANQLASVVGISIELTGTEVEVTISQPGDVTDAVQGDLSASNVLVTKVFDGSITTGSTAYTTLTSILPSNITTDYFYQLYRTAIQTVQIGQTINDLDPGDEQYFILEAPITAADITAGKISIEDNTPEIFRESGAYLYTNATTGTGIVSANERPPVAHDIAIFRNSTFYSNTKDVHRFTFSILSVDDFVSGSTVFTIGKAATTRAYTFTGVAEVTDITVAKKTLTTNSTYFEISSANNERRYYVWFDTGSGVDPALSGKLGVRIPLELYDDTEAESKLALITALESTGDFTCVDFSSSVVRVTCADSGVALDPVLSGTPPGWTFSVVTQGTGEDAATNKVLLSQNSSVAISIDLTARSLVRVINSDASCPIFAQYLSGADDLPGKILLEAKSGEDIEFYVQISDSSLSQEFTPEISSVTATTTSDNNEGPNRLYFSKTLQPEAVPITNYIDVGSKDKPVLRILPLRDNLFVLKEDGIYVVTGDVAPNFSVRLLDNSATLIAPDSAVVLNNLIYCLTTQGVVSISETGVSIVSRDIEDLIKKVTTFNYDYRYSSFGVAYESDRSYLLWLPTNKADEVATQCFRFNTITNTWVRWTIANTCGLVNAADDRLYLGKADRSFIARERKDGTREDFADRDFTRNIGPDAIVDLTIKLNSTIDVGAGDVILQKQYVTPPKFNRLLKKLDMDTGVTDGDFFSTLEIVKGDDLANKLTLVVTKLNADPSLFGIFTVPSGSNDYLNLQEDYNTLIGELNLANSGSSYKTYKEVEDLIVNEVLIEEVNQSYNIVTTNFMTWFVQGEVTIHKTIECEVQWAPQHFGNAQIVKQIHEGTVLFEKGTIYGASISYSSDRSGAFQEITFKLKGPSFWGGFSWADTVFGGEGNGVPVRTLIPVEKSRCRYLNVRFKHKNAREQFKLLGISLEVREIGSRGYR